MGEGVKNGKPWDSIASFKKRDARVVEEGSPAPSCSTLNTTVKGVADGIRTRDTQIHSLVRASTAEEGDEERKGWAIADALHVARERHYQALMDKKLSRPHSR